MRTIIYLRVSTDKQAEEGLGLDVQEAACRKWAKINGHRVVGVTRDEGVSGSNGLDTRKGLYEAISCLRDGDAQGIIVYRLDRLARDLILQETLLREITRIGGQVFTTSAAEAGYLSDDPDDPSRKLIRQILGAVNEYERSMIALRLRSGRAAKASRGGFAYGAPAFGQRAEDGQLTEDDAEQAVIVRIRAMDDQGMSLRAISTQLNAEGIGPKRGGKWHPQTVSRVLGRVSDHS